MSEDASRLDFSVVFGRANSATTRSRDYAASFVNQHAGGGGAVAAIVASSRGAAVSASGIADVGHGCVGFRCQV